MFPPPGSAGRHAALVRKASEISSIAYSMAVPPGLGYLADRYFESLPVGLIIGALLGFVSGTLQLFRLAGMISTHRNTEGNPGPDAALDSNENSGSRKSGPGKNPSNSSAKR